jgi:hypothetical protein
MDAYAMGTTGKGNCVHYIIMQLKIKEARNGSKREDSKQGVSRVYQGPEPRSGA